MDATGPYVADLVQLLGKGQKGIETLRNVAAGRITPEVATRALEALADGGAGIYPTDREHARAALRRLREGE